MPMALQNSDLVLYSFMGNVIIAKLKHSSILKSKHSFLFSKRYQHYNKGMVKLTEKEQRLLLAKRVDEAITSIGRGGKVKIAKACDISPTAITGWIKNGRISKTNIEIVSKISGYNLNWLISGKGEKLSNITDILAARNNIGNGHETLKIGIFAKVPVVGSAQLGDNGYWCELEYPVGHGDGYVNFAARDKDAYALRCVGDSMKPRIRNGEFVVVEPNYEALPGDDVMLKAVDGRVMVKTYLYTRDGMVHLMSVNEAHPPQSFALDEIDKIHPIAGIANKLAWIKD